MYGICTNILERERESVWRWGYRQKERPRDRGGLMATHVMKRLELVRDTEKRDVKHSYTGATSLHHFKVFSYIM